MWQRMTIYNIYIKHCKCNVKTLEVVGVQTMVTISCVCVCVCVMIHEMCASLCLCKCSGLVQDGVP